MKPGVSIMDLYGLSNIHIQSWINPIPHIDTYFFKIYSNIVLLFMPRYS